MDTSGSQQKKESIMSDILLVRLLLEEAKAHTASPKCLDLIDRAIANSYRKYIKQRVPCESQKMTRVLANIILNDYWDNQNQSCMTLARKHMVNPGRISELISGRHEYS